MFEAPFMRVALVASVAAAATLATIGVYVVIRRVIFLGLVLANAATVGAAVAQAFGWPAEVAAIIVTLAAALVLGLLPTPRRISAESLVGWAYAAAASATVLVLAGATAADADTLHLLYGNVLAVSASHAGGLVMVGVAVAAMQLAFGSRFLLVSFDAEAARIAGVNTRGWSTALNLSIGVATAAAVHEIGALLTFSLLTLPAAAALLVARRIQTTFAAAAVIGTVAVATGLALAFRLDLPPGPISVGVLVLTVVVAAMVGRLRD